VAIATVLVLGGSAATGNTSLLGKPVSGTHAVTASGVSTVVKPTASAVAVKPAASAGPVKPKALKQIVPTLVIKTESTIKSVKYGTTTIHDASLAAGTKVLRDAGKKGKIRLQYRVQYVKGKLKTRALISQKLVTKPKNAVYIVGTGKASVINAGVSAAAAAAARTGTPTGSKTFAQVFIAKKYGWSSGQFSCLVSLWNRESHWRHTARNRGSGAYGIPQAMPGSKMSKFGADWRTNPATQIKWGANYIAKRYHSPCQALSHSNATGWY
jgi:hypothetical protein